MDDFVGQTLPEPLPAEPLGLARAWLEQATRERVQPNPNAITLATLAAGGQPRARIVLCKDIVAAPGYLVFYTNYESDKGRELAAAPRAAALFHWDLLHRQVRVEGPVLKAPTEDSDRYFASRPWQSRVGAWASQQSRPVGTREALIEQLRAAGRRLGTPPVGPDSRTADESLAVSVPRPPHWGGYRLWAEAVELWVEGAYRLHDRARFTRTLTPAPDGGFTFTPWRSERLQP